MAFELGRRFGVVHGFAGGGQVLGDRAGGTQALMPPPAAAHCVCRYRAPPWPSARREAGADLVRVDLAGLGDQLLKRRLGQRGRLRRAEEGCDVAAWWWVRPAGANAGLM
jgi:hypothetical protein